MGGTDDGNLTTFGVRYWQTSSYPFTEWVHYTSPTAVEATPTGDGRNLWPFMRLTWWKFSWEGNYKRVYYSVDGVNWIKWFEDSFGSYNAPSQFGIFIDPMNNANKISLSLLHWEES